MRELKQILVSDLRPDPDQPRKKFEEAVILAMADSLRAIGVQVPLIVIEDGQENRGSK